ncbi:MAG: hypothetical protein ABSA94_11885 [Acidobacteriaceae bacterium]|jgi:hypothetical protein
MLDLMARAADGKLAGVAAMAALCALALWAEKKPAQAPATDLQPAVRIEVAPLGYLPPGGFYLTYRLSSAALGFFDDDHLMFTFRVGGLLNRVPNDPADDDDQQIRAMVLDLSTGKAVHQAEWRMHDRGPYLWPFAGGKFLVRRRDSLFLADQSLELQPWLDYSERIRDVQVSPDRRMVVVETDDSAKLRAEASEPRHLGSGQPVKVMVLAAESKTPIAQTDGQAPVLLPLMGNGLLDMLEGKLPGYWVMRDVPFHGDPKLVAQVRSSCRPSVKPLSATVVLLEGCYLDGSDHQIDVISMDGRQLWRDRWENRYVWAWFDTAENGSRFAYESIAVSRPISTFDALYPEDITGQIVGVYDTESGKLVMVRDVTPVLTAGQNVALSPDGTRFAVLRNGAIEVYDLPPVEAPQQKAPEVAAKKKK